MNAQYLGGSNPVRPDQCRQRGFGGKYLRRPSEASLGPDAGRTVQSVLQSVSCPTTAFHVLRCHPWPCMLLSLCCRADSIPSALTSFRINDVRPLAFFFVALGADFAPHWHHCFQWLTVVSENS